MYFDWGCGYHTNDLMKVGEFDFDTYEGALPELYKANKFVDQEKRVWYPTTVNLEGKGTVFLNVKGTSVQWSAIKSIPLSEQERQQPKYKGATHKSDPKSLKHFENDFIEACSYIGVFDEN